MSTSSLEKTTETMKGINQFQMEADVKARHRRSIDTTLPLDGASRSGVVVLSKGGPVLKFEVPLFDYAVDIYLAINTSDVSTARALLVLKCRDEKGNVVSAVPAGFTKSANSRIGTYRYVQPIIADAFHSVACARIDPAPRGHQYFFEIRGWAGAVTVLPNVYLSKVERWTSSFSIPEPRSTGNKIATLADEFTDECFRHRFDVASLTRQDWRQQMGNTNPELLFVESAWKGVGGSWTGTLVNYDTEASTPLKDLIGYCKERRIPTVFWNKEDPPNYDRFCKWAGHFDQIYTTDANCIPKYRQEFPDADIDALPFFIEPRIHNPIGKCEQEDRNIAFAGTWYGHKHQERIEAMPPLLRAARAYGLTIFDRMSDWKRDDTYRWPDEFQPYVKPKVTYSDMLHIHRLFKILLNTNSVMDSPTMFSRRIFEVLASSTPVVSTEGLGVRSMFPGIVPIAVDEQSALKILRSLMEAPWFRRIVGHVGYRTVMRHHTIAHRMKTVFAKAGRRLISDCELPSATVVVSTKRPEMIQNVVANLMRQTVKPRELIVVLHGFSRAGLKLPVEMDGISSLRIIEVDGARTLGYCLNLAAKQAVGDIIFKMDDDDWYGRHYIEDSLLPFLYSDAMIVGKGARFIMNRNVGKFGIRFRQKEHTYTNLVAGGTLAMRSQIFDTESFPDKNVSEDTGLVNAVLKAGGKVYAADPFGYCYLRDNRVGHSWTIADDDFMRSVHVISDEQDLDLVEASSDLLSEEGAFD